MLSSVGGAGLTLGLDDLRGLLNLINFIILLESDSPGGVMFLWLVIDKHQDHLQIK